MARSLASVLLVGALFQGALRETSAQATTALPATMVPTEILPWVSADGWQGWVRHYPGPGMPVLLVHGMSANHENFDFRPEVSLAAYLVGRGWDVWVPDLRGDPGTLAPTPKDRKNYRFDDHADLDIPAILDTVTGATGVDAVAWVGHSMGGMLLYATLTRSPERISEGVAIASPSTFAELTPLKRELRSLGGVIGRRGLLPNQNMARHAAAFGRANPVLGKLADRAYMDPATERGLTQTAIVDLPRAMVQEVRVWLRAGTLTRADGITPWVTPADVPVLALAGEGDWIAPAADVVSTCTVLPRCEDQVLGPTTGFSHPFGHVDLVLGTTSRDEVYPIVGDWLAARQAERSGAAPAVGISP